MNRDKPNELGFSGGVTVRIQNKLPLGMVLCLTLYTTVA